jgi:hypothetical protein
MVFEEFRCAGLSALARVAELLHSACWFPYLVTHLEGTRKTADVRPEDQERALRIGLRDLILKPDTVDQLGRVLDRVFQHELTDYKASS